jgi:hypothetical protein
LIKVSPLPLEKSIFFHEHLDRPNIAKEVIAK